MSNNRVLKSVLLAFIGSPLYTLFGMREKITHSPLKIFWLSGLITAVLGVWMLTHGGVAGLWLFAILVVLEVTFSFDNAVINSRVLVRMSPFWQKLFLTVGIFIAVFVVRFLLPIFIVMLTSGHGFSEVVNLALNDPEQYGETLKHAAPTIDAFGGTFLAMIGISYFMNRHKDIHWLGKIERKLVRAGNYENFKVFIMLTVAMALYFTVDDSHKITVLVASIVGTLLHIGLEIFGSYFEKRQKKTATNLVGMAAFGSFMYLEILDASFSLDGVIGAFAITNEIVLIIAGLGAGAIWVRSLTVYLMKSGTLAKYKYLEHGAHWAILALGIVMLVKLYHVEPPEWFTGTLGLIVIAIAIASSVIEQKRAVSRK